MQQNFSVFEGINRVLEWFARFAVLNLLWVIFNLPISILVISLALTNQVAVIVTTWFIIALLAPFFFFPATTAMYAVVRKWILGERDLSVIRSYWGYYRENYKRSLASGALLVPIWIICVLDIYYFFQLNLIVSIILIFMLIFLFIYTTNLFAINVHFSISFKSALRNALSFTLIKPFNSLVIAIINLIILYLSLTSYTFLLPFFTGSTIAFLSYYIFNQKFSKVQEMQEK
ncbi:putative membrane protein YesL [Metabacillus crassostreae]|uniref:YesL family protein n=1 Tax=Metabacillus crassostreae TaxID=929098 RepID=UPI00195D7F61|nr:DUF624 domain-containing protein [Metabacillus crassostreae]MBM7603845.1 putative membrane protein YesL [Metabacillus crassostreae]